MSLSSEGGVSRRLAWQCPCWGRERAGAQDPSYSPSLIFLSLPMEPEPQGLALLCASSNLGSALGFLIALDASVENSMS